VDERGGVLSALMPPSKSAEREQAGRRQSGVRLGRRLGRWLDFKEMCEADDSGI